MPTFEPSQEEAYMIKYIIKRVIAMLITLFIIVSLCFLTIRMIPGDIVGQGAQPEIREAMEARYHLNDPLPEQYVTFLRNFFTLDFGESITTYPRRPVFDIILEKIPLTLQLNLLSLVITIPLGILFGILAALKKNKPTDHAISLAQRSGNTDTVMEEIARRLSQSSEAALEQKVSRVEPALVITASLLVGAILLSVMLPLMNIMSAIG